MERDCLVHSIYWCNSLNCAYLYDADGFLQFRLLICVLELISVPIVPWDSFILIKFNTLYIWREIVLSIGFTGVFQFIGHIFMMQMDSFNFEFWFGFRPHFRSEWLLRFIYFNKIQHFDPMERDCLVHSIYWCNSLDCAYLYDADGFLQFLLLIRVLELISVPNESWDSYILIKFNTLKNGARLLGPLDLLV